MLIRSSSTPVTRSQISHFSDSPSGDCDNINLSSSDVLHPLKLTSSFSCCSSPVSHSASEFNQQGLRRASSDGNLKGLVNTSRDIEETFRYLSAKKKTFSCEHNNTMLRAAPSFSVYSSVDGMEDEERNGHGDLQSEIPLNRTVTIEECIEFGGGDFSFGNRRIMGLIMEEGEDELVEGLNGIQDMRIGEEIEQPVSPPMYLATGLGIDAVGFDNGGEVIDLNLANFDPSVDPEEYYKIMVDEYPCHPLFLRNYAQLLQTKGDLYGAEDYYHRATMADPGDGEILMQYAKLVWELHRDQNRALTYFERAAQAAPQDSNILATYANFLWEMDNGEDDTTQQEHIQHSFPEKEIELVSPSSHFAAGLGIDEEDFTAADANSDSSLEEYHRRMVEENPDNSLVLKNYAQFLSQSKGDLQGAEEYYSRAILADPADGEIMSQYAKLVWELHHDRDKASCYFERAVEATPIDSHVLAAYAYFLWETEEDEVENGTRQDQDHLPQATHFLQGAVTTVNV